MLQPISQVILKTYPVLQAISEQLKEFKNDICTGHEEGKKEISVGRYQLAERPRKTTGRPR
jgi:hypothetical protein